MSLLQSVGYWLHCKSLQYQIYTATYHFRLWEKIVLYPPI